MGEKIVKIITSNNGGAYEYEYLDSNLLIERVQGYLKYGKIINGYFVPGSLYMKSYNRYMFDDLFYFLWYNTEELISLLQDNHEHNDLNKIYKSLLLLRAYRFSMNEGENNPLFILQIPYSEEYKNEYDKAQKMVNSFLEIYDYPIRLDVCDMSRINKLLDELLDDIKKISKELKEHIKRGIKLEEYSDFGKLGQYISLHYYLAQRTPSICKDRTASLLCDELYLLLYSCINNSNNPLNSIVDFSFVNIIFENCRFLLRSENFNKCDKKQKDKVLKYYYLSAFFGNEIGNVIDSNDVFSVSENYAVLNIAKGFNPNISAINVMIEKSIKKYEGPNDDTEIDVDECFNNMQIKDDRLLATAYYQKLLCDYSPVFKGMEYTPVLVNLYKSVEEIICGLFKKLGFERCKSNGRPLKYGKSEKAEITSTNDWEDRIMLGDMNEFINSINSDTYPMSLDKIDITEYIHGAYNKSSAFNDKTIKAIKNFMILFNCEGRINKGMANNEILYNTFDCWRQKCRNGCLHKHNTLNKEDVDNAFNFTALLINLLLKWYTIIQKCLSEIR